MEPIEYDVVEFFLQGGVGWVGVPPNFGTCFRQKNHKFGGGTLRSVTLF